MIADRQLSANFWLHEFPEWEKATEADVARLKSTVQQVLQPTRNRWGRVRPTSWRWWSGGVPRDGAHRHGGTVDFVTLDAPMREVASWGVEALLPSGYIGRWIWEPERGETSSTPAQGEHIHVAPVAAMAEVFGISDIGAFEETTEGTYVPMAGPFWGPHTGAYGDPIPLPGIVVAVPHNLGRWLLLGAAVGFVFSDRRP